MAYLKINNIDFSKYVNELKVGKEHNYNAQTNAAGNTVVDYVNCKREIEVGIIPLDSETMSALQQVVDSFLVALTFLNPDTNEMEEAMCIIPSTNVEYYTIQANNVMFKAFSLKCLEL